MTPTSKPVASFRKTAGIRPRLRPRRSGRVFAPAALIAVAFLLIAGFLHAQSPATGCATPREAVQAFLRGVSKDAPQPELAVRCFDFSSFSGGPGRRFEMLRLLKKTLDGRGLIVDLEKIPAKADYLDEKTGLGRVVLFPRGLPEINLEKTTGGWLFSAESVRAIEGLYDETFSIGIDKFTSRLPAALRQEVFGVAFWRYIALMILVVVSLATGRAVEFVLGNIVSRRMKRLNMDWGGEATQRTRWPFTLLIMSAIIASLLPEVGLPVGLNAVLFLALKVMSTGSIVLIAYRLNDVFFNYLERLAAATETRLDDQLVPLVRKAVRVVLILLGFLFILQNLNVNIGSLMAGLGLGGLAFALAAKDTLANLFGSITIFLDRPFQIGDYVIISGVEGTVEEVGFRSTRVRTFYKSLVTLPNARVADALIDNMGARTYRRLKLVLGLTYSTTPEQMQAFVEGIRAALQANPKVWHEYYEVHFNDFGASSLDVLVYAFLDVRDWSEELRQRHNLLMEFLRLGAQLGVSFAFPSHSLYLESMPAEPKAPLSEKELRDKVKGFGPGGGLARPGGAPLTHGFFPGKTPTGGEGR